MNLHCGILQSTQEEYALLMENNKSCLLINIKDPKRDEWLLGVKEGEALLKFESDFIPTLNTTFFTVHSYQTIDVEEQRRWFSYIRALQILPYCNIPEKIEVVSEFTLSCFSCDSKNNLRMFAQRGENQQMVGWIFICDKCEAPDEIKVSFTEGEGLSND